MTALVIYLKNKLALVNKLTAITTSTFNKGEMHGLKSNQTETLKKINCIKQQDGLFLSAAF